MAISADYPSPVTVNGFSCRNCTEVDEAKKFIDPAHPKDGPFGINARDHGPRRSGDSSAAGGSPSVVFGGRLASLPAASSQAASAATPSTFSASTAPGARLDISV